MKRKLFMLLALLGGAIAASAQVTYTCTAGKNFGQNEGMDKLFDGNLNTKYCQNAGDDCYALVTASEPVYVWGYDMSTANDNEAYGRLVTRWTLCGTNDENVATNPNATGWVTLSGFGANGFVQRKNFYTQRFFCDKEKVATAYKYFKVVLNEGGFIQVSEFKILGETRPVVTYNWVEGSNNDTKKAVDWLLGQKWEGSGGNSIKGKYFVIETNDGKPHPVESYSMSTHDDGSWNDRAPKSWVLEGSNDKTNWITIDEVVDDQTIQNENYKTFEFIPSNTTDAVRYLKLTIKDVKGTGYTQLGEFHVKGGYMYTPGTCPEHDIIGSYKEATCAEAGYINGTCWKCGHSENSVKPATGNHNYVDHYCTVCHRPDPSFMTKDGDYYEVSSAEQLNWIAAHVAYTYEDLRNVKFKLTADIDLQQQSAGFPCGSSAREFKGEFDGQGHWIKNLKIDLNGVKNCGFFGKTDGATIKNVGFDNCYVRVLSEQNSGVVVGNAKNTTISGVAVVKDSYSESWDHTGAIVGNTEGSTIVKNCLSDITVLSGGYQAGGLIGTSNGLTLENCLFIGEVRNNNNNAAGLVALIDSESNPTTLRNNISAARKIWTGANGNERSLIETGGRNATYVNNRVAASTIFQTDKGDASAEHKAGETRNFTVANDQNGLTTADREMQCKSFLSETMGWDMTNDWKMVAAGQWPVLAWMEATTPTQTVTVTDAGYATFVAAADLDLSTNVVPVYAATINDQWVVLNPITTAIPAGEAVVVKADAGNYNIPYAVDYASAIADNELKASAENITADGTHFVLAKRNDKVAFYKAQSGTTIAAGKGYLVSTGANINALYFGEDETAINDVNDNVNVNENLAVYNLAGQRISKMQRGINIVNGKKIIK